jgi:hypothetical protein
MEIASWELTVENISAMKMGHIRCMLLNTERETAWRFDAIAS